MFVESNMNPTNIYCDRNEEKQSFDLNKSCRVCLSHNINMINIFEDSNSEIMDKIEFCTGIQLKEEKGLPTNICGKCLNELSIAYKFKAICLLSAQTLQQIYLKRIKIDIPDDKGDVLDSCVKIDEVNDSCDLKDTEVESDHCEDSSDKEEKCLRDVKKEGQKLLKEKESKIEIENKEINKRGPYKKGGGPRLKKFKFSRLRCEPCDLKFTSKQESDKHKKDAHLENISWICEICGKTFVHRSSLYTHARSHFPPRYACEHCDYSSAIKYDLEKHLRIHLGVKKYKCSSCAARFHTTSNLRAHERRAHRPPERAARHACARCPRRFHDRSKLRRHLDAHDHVQRFKCELCLARFTRRCHWKRHLERQHSVAVPPQRPGRRPTRLLLGEQPQ
ncbi:zinc finger protein 75A-like [Nymphalis io]|uniref:zinc finger protein 75A-like n=1 Tax=Inachis io TaxID=171585 RepID=UPI0021681399|nr:zinc finger protein 75A-like [Nymphalis io]